jgi:glycine/D-amino acid oxidase-like deaminating enzyme
MSDDSRSHGLWEATAPPAPDAGPLADEVTVDVAIVGGGFTGLSAALHLQFKGASTAVIEAAEIGFGGSGRNVGLVNAGMWTMPSSLAGELGEVHGQRLLTLLGSGPDLVYELVRRYEMDCDAVRNGTLHCAVGSAGLKNIEQRAREWQAHGAPVSLLDAAETARRTGTRRYRGALLDLRAGTIQPLAYVRGLARAAIDEGARVYTRTRVREAEDLGDYWRLRTDTGGSVKAKWVIVATNAFTEVIGPWSALRTELVRLPYFNMATTPLPAKMLEKVLPGREGAWDTPDVLTSFRLDRRGRLVLGSVGALRGLGSTIHRDWGRRALVRLFPQLEGIDFQYEWYGWIGMTADALPRFHHLARNTVSFSGYNGRGIATGTTFGRELARLVLGEISEVELALPVTLPKAIALRSLKERYYEVGAQVAHLSGARMQG